MSTPAKTDFGELRVRSVDAAIAEIRSGALEKPTLEDIEDWVTDSTCEATDGCEVEPDGVCEHGKPAWLEIFMAAPELFQSEDCE